MNPIIQRKGIRHRITCTKIPTRFAIGWLFRMLYKHKDFADFHLSVTYKTNKNAETIVEIPIIIAISFPEKTFALKLTIHLQELST